MKNIAIVAGGDSSEYVVSLRSAQGLYEFINKDRYHLYIVLIRNGKWTVETPDRRRPVSFDENQHEITYISQPVSSGNNHTEATNRCKPEIDKNDFSFQFEGQKIKFDYAYITIHGHPGEDGRLQGYFDLLGIPYSSSGVLTGALTFNKYINNQFLKTQGICVADAIRLQKTCGKIGEIGETEEIGEAAIIRRLGLPVFVKPNDGGSSFGVAKVKAASQLLPAIEKAFAEGNEVIIERFLEGKEVTCGCYKTKTKQVVFPVTEVIPKNEFFDYNAKYHGESLEITPARLSDALTDTVQQETLRIYDLINAKGIIRVDYIINSDNQPFMLEVNTTPGMTKASFIPQQIKAAGLDIKDIMTDIIENI